MGTKITLDIIEKRLKGRNIKIIDILDRYYVKETYSFKCLVDGEHPIIRTKLSKIFSGQGCRYCANNNKKTDINEFITRIKDQNIEVVKESYNGLSSPAEFKCLTNKNHPNWFRAPNKQLISKGCPKCAIEATRVTLEEVLKRLSNRDDIQIDVTTYTKASSPAKFKCLSNKNHPDWFATPKDIMNGKGCKLCYHENRAGKYNKLTKEAINKRLKDQNRQIELVDEYNTNNCELLRYNCLANEKHGMWKASTGNILAGRGCPRCHHRISKAEGEIVEFLKERGLKVEQQNTTLIKPYHLDIIIPDNKLAIEYHGLIWHSELFNSDKHKHLKKRELCEKQGMQLLQFWDYEWLEKQEIVKSVILSKLGIYNTRIYARKCKLREVQLKDACSFLNMNHLMGEYRTAKYIGLYYQDMLVAIMGYKKHKDGVDISRYSTLINTQIIGGLTKMLKYVERATEGVKYIQYFVDLRYGSSKTMESLGFEQRNITLGMWWTDKKVLYNRLYCRANMDKRKLKQNEHAKEMGLHRIYDAGQAKFIKEIL